MRKGRRTGASALALTLCALPALAGGTFTPPAGCEAFLTVQMKSCQTALMWRCGMAPEGDLWDAVFTEEGLQSVINYDREFQWIEANYMWDGAREALIQPSEDPISLTELLATGIDTFAFLMRRTAPGEGARTLRVIGADQLTGEEVVIDGVRLLATQTEFRIMNEAGEVEYHNRGAQYVSPEMRVFFLGTDTVIENGEEIAFDNAPVDFIFPGEPGFAEVTPLYGCGKEDKAMLNGSEGGQSDAG